MFVNLETSDFRDVLRGMGDKSWNAIVTGFLARYDREIAVGEIAQAIELYAAEQPAPKEEMAATLYALALGRVDFYTLAVEMVPRAEAANPSVIEQIVLEDDLGEEDLLAA